MSFDLKLPNITASSDSGKVEQIRSYLYQLTEQLNWALNSIESNSGYVVTQKGNQSETKGLSEAEAQATFNSIKSLIINSAEIVEAYSEKISKTLSGEYVAKSDFGVYTENTTQTINADSKTVESLFNSIQKIVSDIDKLEHNIIEVNAHIKSGLLYYDEGVPIYGLEVGQINEIDGEEVFNKFARFTSDRLSFYDKNDTEVAYISDYRLYITNAQITGTLILGRFVIDTSDGLAIKWV
jgi:thiamine phosphate synthase YjbQ (UPF0047 family)